MDWLQNDGLSITGAAMGRAAFTFTVGEETCAVDSETVPVHLVVQRFEGNFEDMARDRTRHVYPDAKWVARGEAHFVTVEESMSKDGESRAEDGLQGEERLRAAAGTSRTVYRIEPGKLTINRFGAIEWHHRFVPGEVAQSRLSVKGAGQMDVTTQTSSLYVKLGEQTGELQVQYVMNMGGVEQEVEIRLAYEPLDGDDPVEPVDSVDSVEPVEPES